MPQIATRGARLKLPRLNGRIGTKALLIIGVTIVSLILVFQVVSANVVVGSFEELERTEALQNVERVRSGMANELSDLDAINKDWSSWDDTYEFVDDLNLEYYNGNLVSDTMANLRLDVLVIINHSGGLVASMGYDIDLKESAPIPDDLIAAAAPEGLLFNATSAEQQVVGTILLDAGPMLVSARPILRSDASGPANGDLIMGRWFDANEIESIAGTTHLNLTAVGVSDPQIVNELGTGGLSSLSTDSKVTAAISQNTIAGYSEVKDIYGQPALVLRVSMPRTIYQQGVASVSYLILAVSITGVVFAAVMLVILNRTILGRLRSLNNQVSAIGPEVADRTVEIKGEDELSSLARSINGMLRAIRISNQNLMDSERRYRGVVEDQTDVIGRFGPDLQITFANEAASAYFGLAREQIIGRRAVNIMPPEDAEHFQAMLRSLTPASPIGGIEHRAITPEGVRWLRASARAIIDQKGAVKEYQVVGKDITEEKAQREELKGYQDRLEELVNERTAELDKTNKSLEEEIKERKLAETQLIESQRRYRAVVEDQTELIFRANLDGKATFTNTAYAKYYGTRPENGTASVFVAGMPPEDREKVEEGLRTLSKTVPVITMQTRHISPEGEARHQLWTYRAILDKDGEVAEVQGVGRDISDRIKMETELRKSEKLESVGLLAGGIAHDFNNVLTSIISNITLARAELPSGGKGSRKLAEAEAAVMRARGLTNRLLTFSEGGAPIKEVTTIPELTREAVDATLRGTNVTAKYFFTKDLKQVEIDRDQIGQVIGNLIQNSLDAMPEGGSIKVAARNEVVTPSERLPLAPGDYVKISIQDSGCGIDKEILPKIFDPFYTTKSSGAGLGLTTANSIVLKHHGYVDVDSAAGVGTTVSVYLPTASESEEDEVEPVAESKGSGRVLLMDDETSILEVVSELLIHLGYEVETAEDGQAALDKYRHAMNNGRFDAVIMDLTIPGGMGGKEAITKLLEIDPAAKAIVSSGYSNDPVMSEPSSYGFAGVLQKPYTMKNLDETLKALQNHRQ
jgi:PAS domain S-box-containing protein